MKRHAAAFTLIEIMAAMVLVALLACVVSVSLRGTLQQAQMRDVIRQLARQDHLLRANAIQFGQSMQLVIEPASGTVVCAAVAGEKTQGGVLRMPSGFRLERIVLAEQQAHGGSIAIPCSDKGYTPTYALLLSGPAQQRQWLLVVGLTGEFQEIADENQVQETFTLLRTSRHDLD